MNLVLIHLQISLHTIQTPSDTIQTPPDIVVVTHQRALEEKAISEYTDLILNFANGFGIDKDNLTHHSDTSRHHPDTPRYALEIHRHPQT